ncbi:activator of Hsp90 ATPase, partial [Paraphysoderma sedebokerense]
LANWKNVGNWHWREKNCMPWAKDYMNQHLPNITTKSGDVEVKITSVDSVDGDAILSVRKGKLITIFDLQLKLKWSGQCEPSITATGSIHIPEIAHDTDPDDIVFDITVDDESGLKDKIKQVVRKQLSQDVKKVLLKFGKDLVEANSTDVYIENATKSVHLPRASLEERRLDASSARETASAPTQTPVPVKTVKTTELKNTVEFVAPPSDVFGALTNPQSVRIWSEGGMVEGQENGKIDLFKGMVTGSIEKLDQNTHMLVMKWRLKDWPADHYSTVTITLTPTSSSTVLNFKQTGVPSADAEKTKSVWNDWYWRRIKGVYGWGGF